jgi:ribosomal protein L44E
MKLPKQTHFCYVCKQHVPGTAEQFKQFGHSDEKVKRLSRTVRVGA